MSLEHFCTGLTSWKLNSCDDDRFSENDDHTTMKAVCKYRRTLKRAVCYVLVLVLPAEGFMSCAGGRFLGIGRGNKYVYGYTMTAPVQSEALTFQDDSIKVQFKIDAAVVRFQLQNLSHSNLTVQWDKASLGIDNAFVLARHSVNFYADTVLGKRSVAIPPRGYIRDLMIPVDNVYFDGSQWVLLDLLPTADGGHETMAKSITQSVGKEIAVGLPLLFGDSPLDYRFTFRVVSVRQILWRDYRQPKEIPPPPVRKVQVDLSDQITAAFIAVGILGFVAFMVSLRKTPVAE